MKGKLILVSCKEPKEGKKVPKDCQIWTIVQVNGSMVTICNHEGKLKPVPASKLQQIAIEWGGVNVDEMRLEGRSYRPVQHILPLSPDDYEKALPLIGQEVEFGIIPALNYYTKNAAERVAKIDNKTFPQAVLITPSPIVYTEGETFGMLSGLFIDLDGGGHPVNFNFMNWWDKHKKK